MHYDVFPSAHPILLESSLLHLEKIQLVPHFFGSCPVYITLPAVLNLKALLKARIVQTLLLFSRCSTLRAQSLASALLRLEWGGRKAWREESTNDESAELVSSVHTST